jgi:hypothetical protein
MADNISKTISIDVDVSNDGQQQIALYKTAFDNLRSSISGLSNPLSGLSNSINSLDKDISKLNTSIDKLNDHNQELSSTGEKAKSTVNDLVNSLVSWNNLLKILKISSLELETALTGGFALIATFLPTIINWVGELFKANTTLSALNKALKDNKIVQDAVNQTRLQGLQSAQQELINLKLLYKASQDQNLSLADRKKIVGQLQSQYPDYFGNMSAEAILTGKATGNYDQLTKSIIAASRARAAASIMTKNQERQLGNDDKLQKLSKDLTQYSAQLKAAQQEYDDYAKHPAAIGGSMYAAGTDSQLSDLYNKLAGVRDQVDKTKQAISHLSTDSGLLTKQNDALAQTIQTDIEKSGTGVIGVVANNNNQLAKIGTDTLSKQKSLYSESDKMLQESLRRQLQATYSAYGSETATENKRYDDEKAKLQKLLDDKLISKKQYATISQQLENENHANISSIITKYNEQDKERTEQAQNELNELKIKGMKDGAGKQIAELQQQQTVQVEQLDKTEQESVDRMKKLYAEIEKAKSANPKADTGELQSLLNTEINLQEINSQKRIQIEQQTAAEIQKIKKQEVLDADQKGVDNAKKTDDKLAAEKKLITDKYQFEIEQAQGNSATILALQTELNAKLKQLQEDADKQKADAKKAKQEQVDDEILKDAKQIEGDVLSLITSSIKQQADAKVAALEKDKTAELSNNSLTSAQKLAIQQKYQKQGGQIKAKAFKEEQEASIAQAIINGALAITKVASQTGVLAAIGTGIVIAETAVEVAKIASQKPPAYAKGGLHYSSDGRGGLLSGYSRTDNTNAYLRSGEGIVVSEAMRVPWARNLVSAVNVGFGGRDFSIANPSKGYAVGGIFTDGGDANRYYNAPVADQKNLANSIAYQMVNNFPPVYVDVKDVNNQQNILAQTINRVNL